MQRFVFNKVEVALPWPQIANIFSDSKFHIILFATEDQNRFSVLRQLTPSEIPKELSDAMGHPHKSFLRRVNDRIQEYFLGDLGQLYAHPERIEQLNFCPVREHNMVVEPSFRLQNRHRAFDSADSGGSSQPVRDRYRFYARLLLVGSGADAPYGTNL